MDGARVAGFVVLAVIVIGAAILGAPLALLLMIGVFATGTAFLPGGVGAAAFTNLAQRRYDRNAWQARWSERYLRDRPGGLVARVRGKGRSAFDLPPDLLPDDFEESKAWLRTLHAIRHLPERD